MQGDRRYHDLNLRNVKIGQGDGRLGWNRVGDDGRPKFHAGIDIAAPKGTPVVAVSDGKVIRIAPNPPGYGYQIVLQHSGGVFTQYGHLDATIVEDDRQGYQAGGNDGKTKGSSITIKEGQKSTVIKNPMLIYKTAEGQIHRLRLGDLIPAGQQIGQVGTSGNVPKYAHSHLHFEVRYGNLTDDISGGKTVDPLPHFRSAAPDIWRPL